MLSWKHSLYIVLIDDSSEKSKKLGGLKNKIVPTVFHGFVSFASASAAATCASLHGDGRNGQTTAATFFGELIGLLVLLASSP
eukprot:SAG11_NODE_6116_length_1385_cov_1.580871_2_plen_82_part_01